MAKLSLLKTATGEFGTPQVNHASLGINTNEEVVLIHENGDEEVIGGDSGATTDRTIYLNQDLAMSIEARKMFKTKAKADVWLATLTGDDAPSESNHWTIQTGGGFIDEDWLIYQYIDIQLQAGTRVKSVTGAFKPATPADALLDAVIIGGTISTVYIAEDTILNIQNCTIDKLLPVVDDTDGHLKLTECYVFGGDFSNTLIVGEWERVQFIARVDDITNLSHIGTNGVVRCHFVSAPTSYNNFVISDLPYILLYATGSFESLTIESDVVLFDSSILVEDLTVSAQLDVDGSFISSTAFKITANTTKLTNSKVVGVIALTNAAEIKTTNSVVKNNIQLNDTSTATIKQGTVLLGTITQVDPTTTITDERFVVLQFVDNAAAVAGGLVVGSMYWNTTSSAIKIVTA